MVRLHDKVARGNSAPQRDPLAELQRIFRDREHWLFLSDMVDVAGSIQMTIPPVTPNVFSASVEHITLTTGTRDLLYLIAIPKTAFGPTDIELLLCAALGFSSGELPDPVRDVFALGFDVDLLAGLAADINAGRCLLTAGGNRRG
jgi:hypothetical protein